MIQVAGGGHTREVSYAYFKGFNQFLGNLDILQRVVSVAAKNGSATHSKSGQSMAECVWTGLLLPRPADEGGEALCPDHPSAGLPALPAM